MNIICNNCVGARLYEVTKQQFPNPFMWMSINSDDFIYLVQNYDIIDFNNPTFELEKYKLNAYQTVLITLNNKVKLHYIHYIQDDSKNEPVKELNTNILYKDILQYVKNKWFNRLNRNNEQPTFLYSFNYMKIDDEQYMQILNNLLELRKYPLIILVHQNIKIEKNIPSNIRVEYCENDIMELNGGMLANALKEKIFGV